MSEPPISRGFHGRNNQLLCAVSALGRTQK